MPAARGYPVYLIAEIYGLTERQIRRILKDQPRQNAAFFDATEHERVQDLLERHDSVIEDAAIEAISDPTAPRGSAPWKSSCGRSTKRNAFWTSWDCCRILSSRLRTAPSRSVSLRSGSTKDDAPKEVLQDNWRTLMVIRSRVSHRQRTSRG